MRSALLAAAALAPLALAAAPALAQTTVSAASSTPLATSAAGDVTIASGGTLTLTGAGAAVTLDSNNSITNSGTITANNVSNATAVLLQGGRAGGFTNNGAITLTEDYAASDSANGDGIVEAPFAQGTNRYGVHLTGAAPFIGDVNLAAGSVLIKGVGSYGVLLEAPLQGALIVAAPVTLTGDGGAGVRETAGVYGSVAIGGAITTSGAQSSAVVLNGDVGGRLGVYSSLTSSGYSSLTRPTTVVGVQNVEKTAADVQQGGSALVIGANVAGGVFFGATGTATTDADGDGTVDSAEGASNITSYGAAPAVVVGATGRTVTLGNYDVGDNAFGLIVRGAVSGQGVYDGVPGTGLQVGVANGGAVSLSGGLRNVGTITGGAYDADATGLHILAGSTVAQLRNEGTISGAVPASTDAVTGRGVLIDAGAVVPLLETSGVINGTAIGDKASAAAIVDRSGTLAVISNSGQISASLTGTTTGTTVDAVTGATTAIDLSANTTGVSLLQQVNPSGAATSITGDILLGSGPNTVQFLGGVVTGALSLGAAPSSLTVDGGATYTGALRYGGSQLGVTVGAGVLSLTAATPLQLSSLSVASTGTLRFAVDAAAGTASTLNVSGLATLATNAKVGLNVLTTSATTQTLNLVTLTPTGQLSLGTLDTSLITGLPFLVSASLVTTPTSLQVSIRRRTAAELGLNSSEAPALDGVANGVNARPALSAALLGQTTEAGFSSAFRQLLPERGEGVLRFAEQAARQVGEATGEANDFADAGHAWVQQLVLGYREDADSSREKSQAGGYGAAGGVQSDQGPFGAVGATAMFAIGSTDEKDRPASVQVDVTDLEGGVYWRARLGGLRLEARGGAGYLWLHGDRHVAIAATDTSPAFGSDSKNDRNGYDLSGRFGASYQLDLGRFWVRPQTHLDYFRLHEDGYTESGGGSGVDLSVASHSGDMTSGVGAVELGARFGSAEAMVWRPSLEVGVRDVFDGDTGSLTAGFGGVTGPTAFTLSPLSLKGTNTLAKAKLSVGGRGYDLDFEASGEERSSYKEGAVRAVARFTF